MAGRAARVASSLPSQRHELLALASTFFEAFKSVEDPETLPAGILLATERPCDIVACIRRAIDPEFGVQG